MVHEHDIDQTWLAEHAELNDAKLLDVYEEDGNLVMRVDDEWSAFEGEENYRGPAPGMLVARGLMGAPRVDQGVLREMISDVSLTASSEAKLLKLTCYGQHMIEVKCTAVEWRPDPSRGGQKLSMDRS